MTSSMSVVPGSCAPGSYVEVARLRSGEWGVFTYDRTAPFMVSLKGRWFGKSEGAAMLQAQLLAAKGYELRLSKRGRS